MNKELQQLVIVLALGATAFVLWRAYRDSLSLGKLGNLSGANAGTIPQAYQNSLRPNAIDLLQSLSGTASNNAATVYNNGSQYVNAQSGWVDMATLPPV